MAPKADSTAVAVKDDGQFAIMRMDKDEMSELITENLGGEMLTAQDFDKVVVPGSGGTVWTLPTIDGEVNTEEIVGIIVHTQVTRAYWMEEYSGGGTPPDCRSNDGLNGEGNPGGQCLACPNNKFQEDGSGKLCNESRLIFMVLKDETLPIVIKAPAMSLANARKYMIGLSSKGKYGHGVYTRLTLEKDKNGKGIAYAKIRFERIGDVERPDVTKAYAKAMKPILQQQAARMNEE